MSDNNALEIWSKLELAKDFKTIVPQIERNLADIADGKKIIATETPMNEGSALAPIEHFFMDGVYIREMSMIKDTLYFGAIHKQLHMCFLLEGKVSTASEHGVVEYTAPCYFVATPGVKRVVYAYEDSKWYNIHKNPSNTKDLKELEKQTVVMSYEEYEDYIKNK